MADQRPWWKLWVSALSDDDLQSLSLEDWARWAMLGAHLKLHGEGGAMTCRRPGRALAKLWRTPRWDSLLGIARRLPGVVVKVHEGPEDDPACVVISMPNWKKYQDDTSRERMRNLRERAKSGDGRNRHISDDERRHTTTGRSDGVEEKRGESPLPPAGPSVTANRFDLPPEAFHPDCPDPRWRGHCVNAAWLADHPTVTNYPAMDAQGTPKRCPAHRA